MELIPVSSRGQVVIPEKIRKKYGINPGDRLALFETENALIIRKEEDVLELIERVGWMKLAEPSFAKIWDNAEDEVWNYLQDNETS